VPRISNDVYENKQLTLLSNDVYEKKGLAVLSALGAKICVVPNETAIKHAGCLSNDCAWDGRFRIDFVARQGRA
jgi:hypothetical protein